MEDKLSLIICAYKDSPFLEDCVKSLVNQTLKCDIAISTSTPNEHVSKIAKKYNIPLYINEKSDGYYYDFLYAYSKAKTKYVTLCHQDDIYMDNFAECTLRALKNAKNPIISFSNYYDYKNDEVIKNSTLLKIKRLMNSLLNFKLFQRSKFIRKRILSFGNPICSPTVTFNKSLVKEPVCKCPFRTSHDWYTWIKISSIKGAFVYIKKPLILRRINELSETSLVIKDNSKQKSDLEIFKMFWPEWIAKRILNIYSKSEKNNNIESNKNIFIIDDVFPVENSVFRYQEFSSILENIENSNVLSTFESIRYSGESSPKKIIKKYNKVYPTLSNKILRKLPNDINQYKLLYSNFLYNTYKYLLPIANKFSIPFVFTLYPGGRFSLNDSNSDKMLRKVLNSPYCMGVIVTQKITYEYLLKNKFCDESKIKYIFGGILRKDKLEKEYDRKYYGYDKNFLDICFVAYRYTKTGEDKGYDTFIKVAQQLSKKYENIRFHVVGNFDNNIIDTGGIKNIKFYGKKSPEWFDEFYIDKDIILSPNTEGKIRTGSFDGFPTSCVMEAGLRKVAMFCTDSLNSNDNNFINDKEIVIINRNVDDICKIIEKYYNDKKSLKNLSDKGSNKIKNLYSYSKQIKPRLEFLKSILEKGKIISNNKKNKLFILKFNLNCKISFLLNKIYGFYQNKKKKGRNHNMNYIFPVLYVICTVAGLLLYKYGTTKDFGILFQNGVFSFKMNIISIIGLMLYLLSFLIYMIILPKYDITFILPIVSTATGVLIFISSIVLLGEPSSIIKWIGFIIMTIGVIIVNFR